MAQIIRITSEALQATIRRLLPSQVGFGEDLQATNVITPIIDVTPTAEGSQLEPDFARAYGFADSTAFAATGGSATDLATTPGFWKIDAFSQVKVPSTGINQAYIALNDGSTFKQLANQTTPTGVTGEIIINYYSIIIFLRTGDKAVAYADTDCNLKGVYRQVADVYGNIVNPTGFTFE